MTDDRLTRWEGQDQDGPRAVLAGEGRFPDLLQAALRKLAKYEDAEEPFIPVPGKPLTDYELGECLGRECLEFLKNWKKQKEEQPEVHTILYDKEELYENCTVQVLTNTVTGDVSVGWWENDDDLPPSSTSYEELFGEEGDDEEHLGV